MGGLGGEEDLRMFVRNYVIPYLLCVNYVWDIAADILTRQLVAHTNNCVVIRESAGVRTGSVVHPVHFQ